MLFIGERLRYLRERKGLNQRQLAEAVGINESTISHLEQNRRGVSMKHAVKLADFFELTIDNLLTMSDGALVNP